MAVVCLVLNYGYDANVDVFGFMTLNLKAPTPVPAAPSTDSAAPTAPTPAAPTAPTPAPSVSAPGLSPTPAPTVSPPTVLPPTPGPPPTPVPPSPPPFKKPKGDSVTVTGDSHKTALVSVDVTATVFAKTADQLFETLTRTQQADVRAVSRLAGQTIFNSHTSNQAAVAAVRELLAQGKPMCAVSAMEGADPTATLSAFPVPDEVAEAVIRIWVANVKMYGPLMVALKTCECVTSEGKARPAVNRCTGSTSGRAGAIRLLLELANGLAEQLRAVGSGALVKDGELSEDLLYAIIHRAMRQRQYAELLLDGEHANSICTYLRAFFKAAEAVCDSVDGAETVEGRLAVWHETADESRDMAVDCLTSEAGLLVLMEKLTPEQSQAVSVVKLVTMPTIAGAVCAVSTPLAAIHWRSSHRFPWMAESTLSAELLRECIHKIFLPIAATFEHEGLRTAVPATITTERVRDIFLRASRNNGVGRGMSVVKYLCVDDVAVFVFDAGRAAELRDLGLPHVTVLDLGGAQPGRGGASATPAPSLPEGIPTSLIEKHKVNIFLAEASGASVPMGTTEFERLVSDVKKATNEDAGDARAEISRRVKAARGGRKDAAGRYLPARACRSSSTARSTAPTTTRSRTPRRTAATRAPRSAGA